MVAEMANGRLMKKAMTAMLQQSNRWKRDGEEELRIKILFIVAVISEFCDDSETGHLDQ